jgi:RNA-directed DNA polymerase
MDPQEKYKRLRGFKKAKDCWDGITHRYPNLFAHWRYACDFWPPAMTGAG